MNVDLNYFYSPAHSLCPIRKNIHINQNAFIEVDYISKLIIQKLRKIRIQHTWESVDEISDGFSVNESESSGFSS